jgi:cobalamin biosynthesis Mg chelatase CobN
MLIQKHQVRAQKDTSKDYDVADSEAGEQFTGGFATNIASAGGQESRPASASRAR